MPIDWQQRQGYDMRLLDVHLFIVCFVANDGSAYVGQVHCKPLFDIGIKTGKLAIFCLRTRMLMLAVESLS